MKRRCIYLPPKLVDTTLQTIEGRCSVCLATSDIIDDCYNDRKESDNAILQHIALLAIAFEDLVDGQRFVGLRAAETYIYRVEDVRRNSDDY